MNAKSSSSAFLYDGGSSVVGPLGERYSGWVRHVQNLEYSGGLTLDMFEPGSGPIALFVHGGGWISGDKTTYADEALWLADQGIGSACISYRLAPLHVHPAAVEDVLAACEFVSNFGEVHVIGNSAGGHLSLMAGLRSPFVKHCTAISPMTDLSQPRTMIPSVSWSFLEQYLGSIDDEEQCRDASPMAHVSPVSCGFTLIHGKEDDVVPYSQSCVMHEALLTVGNRSDLHLLEGQYHSFSWEAWSHIRSLYLASLTGTKATYAGS